MPNVFVAGIALVVLTLSCALFICKPLYPIINGLLPYVGSGVSLLLHPYLWKRKEKKRLYLHRHFNEKSIVLLGCPGYLYLDLMLYYSKAEQVSLARQDLCYVHSAFAGIWSHYHKIYHKLIATHKQEFWQLTSCLLACWWPEVHLCNGQRLFDADVDVYIDAVVQTVVRIQSIECIQLHVITTALVLAPLWSYVAQMQS